MVFSKHAKKGQDNLIQAARINDLAAVKCLVSEAHVKSSRNSNYLFKFIIAQDSEGKSPLDYACEHKNTEMVKLLLNFCDCNYLTLLNWATWRHNLDIVKKVIKIATEYLTVDQFIEFTNTALPCSISSPRASSAIKAIVDVMRNAIKEGFLSPQKFLEIINKEDKQGLTALVVAVDFGSAEATRVLISEVKEAMNDCLLPPEKFLEFLNKENTQGEWALGSASVETLPVIILAIKDTMKECSLSPQQFLEFLNKQGNNGRTILICAAINGDTDKVKIIVDAAKATIKEGSLPPEELVKFLNKTDKYGKTALMYAQELGTLTKPINDSLLGYRSIAEDPGNKEAIRILTRAIMVSLGQIKRTKF